MPKRTAAWLRAQGHDAVHAREVGLAQAEDEEILHRAAQEGRVVLTMDLDFPRLLFLMSAVEPGVILIRLRSPTAAAIQRGLEALLSVYPTANVTQAIAVLEENRIRLHRLPLQ